MKLLSIVKGCRIRGQIKIEDIREELNIYELNEKMKDMREKCNHVDRIKSERIP